MKGKQVITYFTGSAPAWDRWYVPATPLGNGEWCFRSEPHVRIDTIGGRLSVAVNPFTRFNEQIQRLDTGKQMFSSTQIFPSPPGSVLLFEADMGAETYNCHEGDLDDACVTFNVVDRRTGMVLDWAISDTKIAVIYERLPVPGVEEPFTRIIETRLENTPGKLRHYEVAYIRDRNEAVWRVDGQEYLRINSIPAPVESWGIGFGLFTLKDIKRFPLKERLHGQGARGLWDNFVISTARLRSPEGRELAGTAPAEPQEVLVREPFAP